MFCGSVAEPGLLHLSWKQTNRNVPWVRISPLPPKNMHRYQSGLMAQPAKLLIRGFESHPMLQLLFFYNTNAWLFYCLVYNMICSLKIWMFFQCTVRLSVRTTAFHAVKTGSIPVPCTIGWRAELVTAPDCKSGVLWHTGFESLVTHHIEAHYSQQQRASAERTR